MPDIDPVTGQANTEAYFDGQWVPRTQIAIPITDVATTRAVSLFEAIRVYDGQPFKLDQHIGRIVASAQKASFSGVPAAADLHSICLEVLARNDLLNGTLRIFITGGDSTSFAVLGQARVVVELIQLHTLDQEKYEQGIAVKSIAFQRNSPQFKHGEYFSAGMELRKAAAEGYDDIVYATEADELLEVSSGDLGIIVDSTVYFARGLILSGITIDTIAEQVAPSIGLEVAFCDGGIPISLWQQANEAFVCGSIKELIPVRSINETAIAVRTDGNVARLQQAYRALATQKQ